MWRYWTDFDVSHFCLSVYCYIWGLSVYCSFLSTIHGRIDQVNQLLELDYQKRGGARYTALDKWTNQLNTLNQAIVSKLTWWHVKTRDKTNGMFNTSIKYVTVLLHVYLLRQDKRHSFLGFFSRMPSISRRLQGSQEHVRSVFSFSLFVMRENQTLVWFFMSLIGLSFHVQHTNAQLLSPNVYEKMYTVLSCILLPIGNKQISLSTKRILLHYTSSTL